MLTAGLTGNIGMGKSYVLSVFRSLGAVTLESDRIVSMLLQQHDVIMRVRKLLGDGVIGAGKNLDKKAVADMIFREPVLRKGLEEIIHPLVFEKIHDFISRVRERGCIVVVEVPLLFEGDYQDRYDKVITVFTTKKAALERLLRSGFSRDEALSRMKTQLPITQKKKRSDYVIDNNGPREKTKKQVENIYRELLEEMKKG